MRVVIRWLVGLLLLATGCGPGGYADGSRPVSVTGSVTLDGKALAGAAISFSPTGSTKGRGSAGRTAKDGTYELATPEGKKGAVAGTYKVVISRYVMPDGSEFVPNDRVSPMDAGARESLPLQYSDLNVTELTATVGEGGGTVNFHLKTPRRAR